MLSKNSLILSSLNEKTNRKQILGFKSSFIAEKNNDDNSRKSDS